jgi:hypothetical protein
MFPKKSHLQILIHIVRKIGEGGGGDNCAENIRNQHAKCVRYLCSPGLSHSTLVTKDEIVFS